MTLALAVNSCAPCTASSTDNALYLLGKPPSTEEIILNLPELRSSQASDWMQSLSQSQTSANIKSIESMDIIDEVQGPLMPPEKRFEVELIIENIRKGKPSYSNDIEF